MPFEAKLSLVKCYSDWDQKQDSQMLSILFLVNDFVQMFPVVQNFDLDLGLPGRPKCFPGGGAP